MFKVKFNTGKGNRNCLALTEPYRPAQCWGDLQTCSEGEDKEQIVPKIIVKLAIAKVNPPRM